MDALDQASSLETKQRQMAIAHHSANQKKQVEQTSAQICIECDTPIPEGRHEAIKGCQYCAHCQHLIEQGKL